MKVLHCSWVPEPTDDFIQGGDFWLWVEDDVVREGLTPLQHPRHLPKTDLIEFLEGMLGLSVSAYERRFHFGVQSVVLPTVLEGPWPAPECEKDHEAPPQEAALGLYEVDAYRQVRPISQLGDLRFLAFCCGSEVRPGSDLLFWHYFSQNIKSIILRDRYIPSLLYRAIEPEGYELHAGWEIVSDDYEHLLKEALFLMPEGCQYGGGVAYEKNSLLKHCAEVLVQQVVTKGSVSTKLDRRIRGSLIDAARQELPSRQPFMSDDGLALYHEWQSWRRKLAARRGEAGFTLLLKLQEAETEYDPWRLDLLIAPRKDPSLQISLSRYWLIDPKDQKAFRALCGRGFDQNLLLALGQAARIYPPLWEGLDEAQPSGIDLSLEEAFAFLKEDAWVLEDAGFTVLVPAWWTPQGRRRAKIRLKASGASPSGANRRNAMDLQHLMAYRYDLALGDEAVLETEWAQLVESKSPLVRFRGQWLALDREKMREMLEFWQRHRDDGEGLSLPDLMRKTAEDVDFFEVEPHHALAEMMSKLSDHRQLEPLDNPKGLMAQLREYQKRGLAWICFLERLGLNGCLADDMGLGKTVQVLARLLEERQGGSTLKPTLLIAPTSVIGNWKKEMERFTPNLRAFIHHGTVRVRDAEAFEAACLEADVVITSYALARRDEKILSAIRWRRVVLDEAQNIKNPASAQSRAVLKMQADHRLALTGTPVENRLLDLWSIFNFLNPGYLGKQAQFRQRYELPIQRDNDPRRADMLKRLIEPFVLRRVKTDPEIIRDLPEKLENRQFCHLSKEQASLYEAVVKDVEHRLGDADGMSRQGLILSTLTRLKQICNHPAQFLHDGSRFTGDRSPKLERLSDMLSDVIGEGESALVFTQFAEIGGHLERHLRERLDCPVFYLHGGVPAAKRERMIAEFQDPETGPGVFLLSLRAGGVGITLTKANHVFHFDRWWNPAVEDQATDRAFRIGQRKNVFVHKFITMGTLEERIDRLIEEKKQVASLIVGNDESWLSQLDNDTFKELIALNHLAVLE